MPEKATARDAALRALSAWRGGGRFEPLVREALGASGLDARDRALSMELAYGVLRNLTRLDHVLSFHIRENRKGLAPPMRDVLRLAAYQLLYLDRVPAHAAVDEAVSQTKARFGAAAGGFVNAVLRSLIREPGRAVYPDPASEPARYLALMHSYPLWLSGRWVLRLGPREAEALMAAGNSVPPLMLRANTPRLTRPELLALFEENGVGCSKAEYAPDGVSVSGGAQVPELPGYAEGYFSVQDEAAQLVSLILAPAPGEEILDAAAAPGGKSAHIAALAHEGARVTAMDISLDKLRLLKENILRLGLKSVTAVQGDILAPAPGQSFDAVLLDAPCSATGVIRRRPEIKHARAEDDVARLAGLQGRMLDRAAGLVRPGGRLVYSVCSIEPEEGELQAERFLDTHPGFGLDDPRPYLPERARGLITGEGFLRTYPHRHGTDGFFAARFRSR